MDASGWMRGLRTRSCRFIPTWEKDQRRWLPVARRRLCRLSGRRRRRRDGPQVGVSPAASRLLGSGGCDRRQDVRCRRARGAGDRGGAQRKRVVQREPRGQLQYVAHPRCRLLVGRLLVQDVRRARERARAVGGGGPGGRHGGRQGVGQEVGQGDDAGAEHSAEGEPKAEGGLARHLVLRGGAQPHEAADLIGDELWQPEAAVTDAGPWQGGAGEGGGGAGRAEGSAAAAAAAVQPASHSSCGASRAGDTLALPWERAHCVLGAMHVDDPLDRSSELDTPMEKEDEEARISVAINLAEAIAPPPHAYPRIA